MSTPTAQAELGHNLHVPPAAGSSLGGRQLRADPWPCHFRARPPEAGFWISPAPAFVICEGGPHVRSRAFGTAPAQSTCSEGRQ